MKDSSRDWFIGLIILSIGFCLGYGIAPKKKCFEPLYEDSYLTVDTLYLTDTLYRDSIVCLEVLVPTLPPVIDTAKVVNDYYTPSVFQDFYSVQDLFDFTITDTIGQNSIMGRRIDYDIKIPSYTQTVFRKPKYTLSGHIDTRLNPSFQFGFKQVYIGAGYDFRHDEPFVSIGLKLWEK